MRVIRIACLLALAGLLAGCGADGEPTPPPADKPGVSITGEARFGVVGNL